MSFESQVSKQKQVIHLRFLMEQRQQHGSGIDMRMRQGCKRSYEPLCAENVVLSSTRNWFYSYHVNNADQN